jgi:hypothetical protein
MKPTLRNGGDDPASLCLGLRVPMRIWYSYELFGSEQFEDEQGPAMSFAGHRRRRENGE